MAARRIEGLQIERAADEILVLKPGAAKSHALNQTASIVFDLSDGAHSKSEMATAIQDRTGLPADERVVDHALDALVDAGLVVRDQPPPAGVTRRVLMQRLSLSAAAAALLPVVEAILLTPSPTPDPPQHQVSSARGNTGTGLPPGHGKPTGVPPGGGRGTGTGTPGGGGGRGRGTGSGVPPGHGRPPTGTGA